MQCRARTADVLRAAPEHGSGVLVDDARLDLFVDATAVRGRATRSNVLRTGHASLKRLDFVASPLDFWSCALPDLGSVERQMPLLLLLQAIKIK